MELALLSDLSRDATLEASKALSRFVNAPVSLGTVRVEFHEDIVVPFDMEPNEVLYAISATISGDSQGCGIVCLPLGMTCTLCDLLFRRVPGTTAQIDSGDVDALNELGNIIIGNYLRSFTRALPGATLLHRAAGTVCCTRSELSGRLRNMRGAGVPRDTLLFEVAFKFRHTAALAGFVLISMDAERVKVLLPNAVTS